MKRYDRIIINTGRHDHGDAWKGRDPNVSPHYITSEDDPYWNIQHEPMTRYGKDLSDRLSPIYEFLKKNAGRPFNKVWSEVCQNFDNRNIAGMHLRDHILQMIRSNGISKEGMADYLYRYHNWRFLVDDQGILRFNPENEKKWRTRVNSKPKVNKFVNTKYADFAYFYTEHGWFRTTPKYLFKVNYNTKVSNEPSFTHNKDLIPVVKKYCIQKNIESVFTFVAGPIQEKDLKDYDFIAINYQQCAKSEISSRLQ